jgi:hypothetical protein
MLVQPLRAATECELIWCGNDQIMEMGSDLGYQNSNRNFTYAQLNHPLTRTSPCEDWSLTVTWLFLVSFSMVWLPGTGAFAPFLNFRELSICVRRVYLQ